MDLKVELSQNSILELGKMIQESVKEEIRNLIPEYSKKSNDEQVLLNRKQACKLLGCSLTTLHYYQKDGRIPFHQVGRKIFFDKTELLNHLKVKSRI
jgi:excisionase family DNA binding protein